ncbi:HAD family hydrolase [Azohydromonas caseinilytica]|uniref:HAD family hydrolase n=1 Tax=Azohydromonas caseinilytica TaxID=2728836 RepID=A0A848FDU6_9BURK|nr:HAD family hydrolase [Azohydromonas caseinilytica]NML16453.1 HAD family hydrolase [Azohydromonas caseinilytica]
MKELAPTEAVLLDIDGTLLDSNDAHAQSWVDVFQRHGLPPTFEQVRALIGKGGDKVLAELVQIDHESPQGKQLSDERRDVFLNRYLPDVKPTPGARALVQRLRDEEIKVVIATSAKGAELQALLRRAGVEDLIEEATTSDDADHSKPDPDIVQAALERAGVQPVEAIMIGDTPYDIEAAAKAGVDTLALRCGGWWDDAALGRAEAIYDSPADLLRRWEESPIAKRRIPGG